MRELQKSFKNHTVDEIKTPSFQIKTGIVKSF